MVEESEASSSSTEEGANASSTQEREHARKKEEVREKEEAREKEYELEVLLEEKRVFQPSKEALEKSNVARWMRGQGISTYEELLEKSKDHEWFWSDVAKELEWFQPWKKTLEWKLPHAKWFVGGRFNIVHNALDKHLAQGRGDKTAFLWEGEPGDVRKITYRELNRVVCKAANALKNLGVEKGDRVTIYLPMIPELPAAMLACAKIGAVHSVVFSGFSSTALRDRVNDAESKVLVTADGGWRRGSVVQIKENADEALEQAPSVESVLVVRRTGQEVSMKAGRDEWWSKALEAQPAAAPTEELDANDALYLLYTSGTTGKPKGVVHVHAGYAVSVRRTLEWVFDLRENDVWWCTADVGWVTGHSYVVYGPLLLGVPSVMYEGAPDYPDPGRWWSIVDRLGVTALYTTPTAIRMFMRFGEQWLRERDLSSLRFLGTVGEPINPEAWVWYYENVGRGKCPVADTWWQTETGCILIAPLPIARLKPGSAGKPFPGVEAMVCDARGQRVPAGKGGFLVLTKPWPGMLATLHRDPERYFSQYWQQIPGAYFTGDAAWVDGEGFYWLQGRVDDVIKVAGHRFGTAELESALVAHEKVAEAAVIGVPHEVKGEVPKAFVTLKVGVAESEELKKELKEWVARQIGRIAKPEEVEFCGRLPKTRSGKIMRRLLKARALGKDLGDVSTLED